MSTLDQKATPPPPPPPPCALAAGFAELRGALARLEWLIAHPPTPPVSGYLRGRY